MTLEQLIARFRTDANDKAQPYFWDDPEVTAWLNDAQDEAAIRGRLLYEASNNVVCVIDVVADQAVYPLHPKLYELSDIRLTLGTDKPVPVELLSVEELDRIRYDWRTLGETELNARYALQDDTSIRLVPTPTRAGSIRIEGYRLPLAEMTAPNSVSEINAAHHRHLVQWALHKAFSIPDTETFDPNRAQIAEREFTRYFGERPDSDLRRSTREDETQTTKAFFP